MKTITLTIELADQHAAALAQFVKRVGWREMRDNAVDEEETYQIRDGILAVQRGLAEAGHAPR